MLLSRFLCEQAHNNDQSKRDRDCNKERIEQAKPNDHNDSRTLSVHVTAKRPPRSKYAATITVKTIIDVSYEMPKVICTRLAVALKTAAAYVMMKIAMTAPPNP